MSVIYIALPVAILLAAGAVLAFLWSVRDGQLDDLDTPPVRMLFDDVPKFRTDSHPSPMPESPPAPAEKLADEVLQPPQL